MREIKFRAWWKDNDQMIYSHEPEEQGKREYYPFEFCIGFSHWKMEDLSELMQFTGLKDKNKVEIYEGDIVSHYATVGTVLFEDGMFTLSSSANIQFGKYKQPLCYIDVLECEVIGNKFENPELLKEVKECYVQ